MKFTCAFIFLLLSIVVKSQIELGLHYRTGKSDLVDQHNTNTLDQRNDYCLGLEINKRIFNPFIIRLELNYETKGAIFNGRGIDFKLPYLTMPVYFGIELFNGRLKLMPGLYIASTKESINFIANTFPTFYYIFNSFDWGLTYYVEIVPIRFKNYSIKINHSLSYGLTSSYDLMFSPRITQEHTDWIRNYKYDFGLAISIKI